MGYLAVYGTLKSNHRNNRLLNGSQFLGYAITTEQYPLTDNTFGTFPYLFEDVGVGHNVELEVFDVDDETLRKLDIHEGVHIGAYYRGNIDVYLKGITIECECYFCGDTHGYFGLELLEIWTPNNSSSEWGK